MNLSRFAVHRPVFAVMVIFIVIILGVVSLLRLPIDLMPDVTYPTLTIRTNYENASPEEIEELVTRPIEEAMSAVPGVESIFSTSSEGSSSVRVSFSWGTDLDTASNDLRDRLDRVISRLPDNAERPVLHKFDVANFPILVFGASGSMNPLELRTIIDEQIKYRIERIPGVASLDVWGGYEREIQVNLDASKLKAMGLPLDQVLSRIREGNVTLPAGSLERGDFEVTVRTLGEYASLEQLAGTVIAVREGVPVRLSDIARVDDTWKKITRIIRVNGKPGVHVGVRKQSGTNTVEVARQVLQEVEKINRDVPQVSLTPIIDTSDYIRNSITNVGTMALYGGLLAVLVLFFFLRSMVSTLIIATSIPISIIATFALMYFGGLTLNLMTLGGLALGIGMLVDNSIVVLENIYRHRETGEEAENATLKGAGEVTAAIVASTMTTLAVFLPLVFIRGMSGVMFKQLAAVVSFSLLCALAVALTLVPLMSSRMLRVGPPGSPWLASVYGISTAFFTRLENGYKRLLHHALAHAGRVIAGTAAVLVLSLCLIPLVGVEFMPSTDEGEVRVNAEMEVGTRVDVLAEKFEFIEDVVRKEVPEMKSYVVSLGGSGGRSRGSHAGEMQIALKSRSERTRSSEEIANDLRRKLGDIPGVTVRTRAGQGLFLMRMFSGGGTEKVQLEIRGYDLQTADILSQRVKDVVEEVEGVTDVQLSRESGSPEELIFVDRIKAADMHLTVSQIADALQTILSGTKAGSYRERGDEYDIRVKVDNAEKLGIRDILDFTVTGSEGTPVVLRNVVNIESRTAPVRIERKDQERVVTVSANISGRDMGSILDDIREGLRKVAVPNDFSIVFGGDYEEQVKAFRELLLSFVLAVLLVYMVMASLYESVRYPFVVMFSVPFASVGVILMLFITGTTFNVQAFIGCIMLGGIVVNNAILLVDHTNLLRRRDGMALREAIEEAGRRRLRPILMTAMTTTLAMVPLAVGMGEGGEVQAPLARTVIGGLISSTLITLIIIPVVYLLFDTYLLRRKDREKPVAKVMEASR
ncbi:MAG: efflux RND transporter permease subunit [Desulfomonilia bacterium]|nr:efflux RND transporter permease subunit [Pseudomonadota bacterium]HPD20701.1 efflux RND transporter permease subunit [Deltaproteobacteria bacterium]HPX19093.1 efflux RND transporter permease subunit [Deltaproteobacteria bacterium]HRS55631.1 efflux RND transporter permease subunit [Desulfomonilia bacterium]HRV35215.1 efflux RND transporter permease subunit [Desulfomonilia bacterium]